ncbi:hypothetical protein MKX08_004971 [Trichoderma sp. CBMAI-0020]|nr:hypothetical protein MKX08_004971 [Trichoderma sp. CBMAI-0020]
MSKHDEEDIENTGQSTQTLRVKVNEGSIEEIQLCLQFSAPDETSGSLLKSSSEDMRRLSLGEIDGGSYESDDLYGDADENVFRTMQGCEAEEYGDECTTQIAAEELEGGGVGDFEYIDEDSAAEDEDVGDARMPGGAVV